MDSQPAKRLPKFVLLFLALICVSVIVLKLALKTQNLHGKFSSNYSPLAAMYGIGVSSLQKTEIPTTSRIVKPPLVNFNGSTLKSPVTTNLSVSETEHEAMEDELLLVARSSVLIAETNAKNSYWKLITKKPEQEQPLELLLTVRNDTNDIQPKGGDLIYATLSSTSPPARQVGRVYNYDNGSYKIEFKPHWAGNARISVILFASSRSGHYVRNHKEIEYLFECTYDSKSRPQSDYLQNGPSRAWLLKQNKPVGSCHFQLRPLTEIHNNECDVSFPAHAWYGTCKLPAGSSCSDLSWCYFSFAMKERTTLFQKQGILRKDQLNQVINGNVESIVITPPSQKSAHVDLVPCSKLSYIRPQGFWLDKQFHNTECKMQCNTPAHIQKCLTNNKLLFLGDSTLRLVVDQIRFAATGIRAGLPHSLVFFRQKFEQRNFSVIAKFHGLPIRTFQGIQFRTVNWTSEIIDKIGLKNSEFSGYDVIFNTNHHFIDMPADMYQNRIKEIAQSLVRLHKRSPNTKVIYVAANARDAFETTMNDHKLRYFNDLAFGILKNIAPNFVFLDIWEMFMASPYPIKCHYPGPVVVEEMKLLCSILRSADDCSS